MMALGLFTFGAYTYLHPPQRSVRPASCLEPGCLLMSDADPVAVVTVMLTLGTLVGVVSLNGRAIASLHLPGGASTNFVQERAKNAKEVLSPYSKEIASQGDSKTAPEMAPPETQAPEAETTVNINEVELAVYSLEELPPRVLADLIARLVELERPLPRSLGRLEVIARKPGRGNHPWFLKFREQEKPWKVSYGGQGKGRATVEELNAT